MMNANGVDVKEQALPSGSPPALANPEKPKTKTRGPLRENLEIVIWALILALIIRTFFFQAFKIPSGSMEPTLLVGDQIMVNKLAYGLRMPLTNRVLIPTGSPRRGDVVVFIFPRDTRKDFVKRVVGLGGDTVRLEGRSLFVNGQQVPDGRAVYTEAGESQDYGPVTVPEGKLLMMGDNRDQSWDSRSWGFVDEGQVRGKAVVVYWSWDRDARAPRWGRLGEVVR